MNIRYVLVIVLVVLALLPSINLPLPGPLPGPSPTNDVLVWKAILNGMADYIEADGKTSKPLISTMIDVERYRDAVVRVPVRGIAGGDSVAAKIAPRLAAITENDLSTNGARGRVVQALRDAAGEL